MQKITESIFSVGVLNPLLRVFDIVMKTEYGTTYNSYIVKGEHKTALIETCHNTYFNRYLSNIREVTDPAGIDYIVLNHCEPDHSGALRRLIEFCPNAGILASRGGANFLANITNLPELNVRAVKDGEAVDLGGLTLSFIAAPFLHWPDSMFTWCPQEKTLFSCDMFGAHYCEPDTFDKNIVYPDRYKSALKYYFDAIFGPFKPYVIKGMERIKDFDIENICCSHGPVLTKGAMLEYALEQYALFSAPKKKQKQLIPVFYCSAYGNTKKLAETIQSTIKEILPDSECEVYAVEESNLPALAKLLNDSDAFAIGSPTINADAVPPVWDLLTRVDAINSRKKPALVFGSYGWSGEAIPNISARLAGQKILPFKEGISVTFVPSESELQKAKDIAAEFAKTL